MVYQGKKAFGVETASVHNDFRAYPDRRGGGGGLNPANPHGAPAGAGVHGENW